MWSFFTSLIDKLNPQGTLEFFGVLIVVAYLGNLAKQAYTGRSKKKDDDIMDLIATIENNFKDKYADKMLFEAKSSKITVLEDEVKEIKFHNKKHDKDYQEFKIKNFGLEKDVGFMKKEFESFKITIEGSLEQSNEVLRQQQKEFQAFRGRMDEHMNLLLQLNKGESNG